MATIQQTAEQIKDILTLCLAKGIDEALIDSLGPNWFDYFRQEDSKNKKEHQILRSDHHSVYDLDFQALLKLMKFHMDLRVYILSYFHSSEHDIDVRYGKNSLFDNLLYRLMTLYRNQISAHKRASEVEKTLSGQSSTTTYSYDDAITDMKKLAENFSTIADKNGTTYYSTICKISDSYYNQAAYTYYPIQDAIDVEHLGVTKNEFIQICEELGIKVASTETQMVFATRNYHETIGIIKKQISLIKSKEELLKKQQNLIAESEKTKVNNRKSLLISLSAIGFLTVIILVLVLINVIDLQNETSPKRERLTTEASTFSNVDTETINTEVSTTSESAVLTDTEISGDEGNRYLNQYNYEVEEGKLSVKPANVYYQDGSIIAKCYIINGTDHKVDSVRVNEIEFSVNGETICDACFNSSSISVNLEYGEHDLESFTFPPEAVKITDAELSNLSSFCDIVEE